MTKEEIRELDTRDLAARLEEMEKDYRQMLLNHSVSPLDNPASITAARRMIARVKTEMRARAIQAARADAAADAAK